MSADGYRGAVAGGYWEKFLLRLSEAGVSEHDLKVVAALAKRAQSTNGRHQLTYDVDARCFILPLRVSEELYEQLDQDTDSDGVYRVRHTRLDGIEILPDGSAQMWLTKTERTDPDG